ncbi:MAG: polyphosphate kinase 1 [Bacteroidetes bacterium]|nr:polyphosphate kinase 1 [Bacteroidota bacterium]
MSQTDQQHIVDRELSWIAFNGRVLQEAAESRVPLVERLRFLAIFSSNLDEFFRVRVASLRSLLRLGRKSAQKLSFDPAALLAKIHAEVDGQQKEFGRIFDTIVPELEKHGLLIVVGREFTDEEASFALTQFENVRQLVPDPLILNGPSGAPFLENRSLYLATELFPDDETGSVSAADKSYGVVEIPTDRVRRFHVQDLGGGVRKLYFLDDILRYNVNRLYPGIPTGGTFSFKMTRDAELNVEDEFSGNLVEMIRASLDKRHMGPPTRFLYDAAMPHTLVERLRTSFALEEEDLVAGGRYHNFNDFFQFPDFGIEGLLFPPVVRSTPEAFSGGVPVIEIIATRDVMLHYPYDSFDPVVRFFRESASDPLVEEIYITLYRVASTSKILGALIDAAREGKQVTAFVEVKARFDEARNLQWAAEMERAGVRVLYSMPGIKVHSKLALVVRREDGRKRRYAYLSTGNFNEQTATLYADHGLFTADREITSDVQKVFRYLVDRKSAGEFKRLLVAPDHLRKRLIRLIDREIAHARKGRPSGLTLKMNSLEDDRMIARLCKASAAGVPVRLVVRGICRLVPGVEGQSDTVTAVSIVDRYLEHARVFVFENGGDREVYLSSADWMKRNLNRRVEAVFPVLDAQLADDLVELLGLQLRDNVTARVIDAAGTNRYVESANGSIRSQEAMRATIARWRAERSGDGEKLTETVAD